MVAAMPSDLQLESRSLATTMPPGLAAVNPWQHVVLSMPRCCSIVSLRSTAKRAHLRSSMSNSNSRLRGRTRRQAPNLHALADNRSPPSQGLTGAAKRVMPKLPEFVESAQTILSIEPIDDPVLLLVTALRFTHYTVHAELAFGEDHENRQESIFKVIDGQKRWRLFTCPRA